MKSNNFCNYVIEAIAKYARDMLIPVIQDTDIVSVYCEGYIGKGIYHYSDNGVSDKICNMIADIDTKINCDLLSDYNGLAIGFYIWDFTYETSVEWQVSLPNSNNIIASGKINTDK